MSCVFETFLVNAVCSAYELYAAAGDVKVDGADKEHEEDVEQTEHDDAVKEKQTKKKSPEELADMCRRFKKTFSREVKVHFVGAWSVCQ